MLLGIFRKKEVFDMDKEMCVELILEVNEKLNSGATLSSLERDKILGCSRKAFKARALKFGYVYKDNIKQFIFDETIEISVTKKTPRVTKQKIIKSKSDTTILESRISELESRIKHLEELVLHNNKTVTQQLVLSQNTQGKTITRSIKVTLKAMQQFNSLCESKYPMYKKQELLSQALLEFVENHKSE